MKKYLIDTNILIEHFRGNASATRLLATHKEIIVSYITVGELLQGARNQKELDKIMQLVGLFELNVGSAKISKKALNLLRTYQPKYGLHLLDALIAATALEEQAVLVTQNIRDFKFIKDITLESLT